MILLLDASSGKLKQGPPRDPLRKHRSNERQYVFDATFGADSTQKEVYEKTTQSLVKSVLEGKVAKLVGELLISSKILDFVEKKTYIPQGSKTHSPLKNLP